MKKYDLSFIGHMCRDEIIDPQGNKTVQVGSAVLCGVMVAVKCGKSVAAIVKMDPEDRDCTKILSDNGIDVHIIPAKETSYMRVDHPSHNLDERRMTLIHMRDVYSRRKSLIFRRTGFIWRAFPIRSSP